MKILSGKTKAPRKCMLYGTHGIGKSTWAAAAPGAVIVNLEDGLNNIDCQRTPHLTTFGQVMEALLWIGTQKHEFFTVVIDSMDWLESLIHHEVATQAGKDSIADIGYGAGYKQALRYWDKVMLALEHCRSERNMAIVLLAHAAVKRFESPDQDSYDRYQPAMHDAASAMWAEWTDELLFASYRVAVRKEDQGFNRERNVAIDLNERYVRTQETAAVRAKNRLAMPAEIEFSWAAYQSYWPK